ncbi:hypothetical protein RRG08_058916 [Elysia crispata]|uniref:Uncharacterized protein n=1 Tax=Elysia crispata TaxID=231223 RepID=A0AAE1CLC5_9GAST|nr:hypothetical protein RRG08_058916 [Elysia crispata]
MSPSSSISLQRYGSCYTCTQQVRSRPEGEVQVVPGLSFTSNPPDTRSRKHSRFNSERSQPRFFLFAAIHVGFSIKWFDVNHTAWPTAHT